MKSHKIKEKKNHIFARFISQVLMIFIIATTSIVLYDVYINIDVEEESYNAEKMSKEINIVNTEDVSLMLENVSKSVVRNI